MKKTVFGLLLLVCSVALFSYRNVDEPGAPADEPVAPADSGFIRFVEESEERGCLETAVVSYSNAEGVRVDLIAAVHLADPADYSMLQTLFASYDAVLYEMIAPHDVRPVPNKKDSFVLSNMQRNLCRALSLVFQLDSIDYLQKNFVHADLTPQEFGRIMKERGETVWTMAMQTMTAQLSVFEKGIGEHLTGEALIDAFRSGNSSSRLKILLAREFVKMDSLFEELDSFDPKKEKGGEGDDAERPGSMIVGERNKAAIGILEREIAAGKKRHALFYGAGHMPDLEARLHALGFKQKWKKWLTAWEIR